MVSDVPPTPPPRTSAVLDPPIAAPPMTVLRAIGNNLTPAGPLDGPAPLGEPAVGPGPWMATARTGVALDLAAAELDTATLELLAPIGATVVRCVPVWTADSLAGVVVALEASSAALPSAEEMVAAARALLGEERAAAPPPMRDRVTGADGAGRLADLRAAGDPDAVFLDIDLDGLDAINQSYGDAGGDAVLAEVARRLQAVVREDDLVIRTVGDEFAVVIRGAEELESIQLVAEVVDVLGEPYDVARMLGTSTSSSDDVAHDVTHDIVSVTAGIGMCVPNEGTTVDLALYTAHQALEEAKRSGRDRLHIIGR